MISSLFTNCSKSHAVKPQYQVSKQLSQNQGISVEIESGTQVSWANYSAGHHVWSSFRLYLVIDNYNGHRPDYISVSLSAKMQTGSKWNGEHFMFQQIGKPNEEMRMEASEVQKAIVFISNTSIYESEKYQIPDIDKSSLELKVTTRSGKKFRIPIGESVIKKG